MKTGNEKGFFRMYACAVDGKPEKIGHKNEKSVSVPVFSDKIEKPPAVQIIIKEKFFFFISDRFFQDEFFSYLVKLFRLFTLICFETPIFGQISDLKFLK